MNRYIKGEVGHEGGPPEADLKWVIICDDWKSSLGETFSKEQIIDAIAQQSGGSIYLMG